MSMNYEYALGYTIFMRKLFFRTFTTMLWIITPNCGCGHLDSHKDQVTQVVNTSSSLGVSVSLKPSLLARFR